MNTEERAWADLIRAAAPREKAPAGLERRIMKRVREHEERRRRHRAIRAMAWICAKMAAVMIVLLSAAIRCIDLSVQADRLLLLVFAGIVFAFGMTCCDDERQQLFREL